MSATDYPSRPSTHPVSFVQRPVRHSLAVKNYAVKKEQPHLSLQAAGILISNVHECRPTLRVHTHPAVWLHVPNQLAVEQRVCADTIL